MAPKILIILTSQAIIPTNRQKTGWYLPELAHFHHEAKTKNPSPEITIATPKGGAAPLDPDSIQASKDDSISTAFLNEHRPEWTNTVRLAELALGRNLGNASDGDNDTAGPGPENDYDVLLKFDAVYYVGGHGPMFDLPSDPISLAILQTLSSAKKPIAAVCHGPAALLNATCPSGTPLIRNSTVTGFSNVEEEQMGMASVLPFALETELSRVAAKYVKADQPWGEKVAVDKTAMGGALVTGQNPRSTGGVARALFEILGI